MEPRVLHEDDQIMVIDKPHGVIVNEAESVTVPTIQSWFASHISGTGDTEFYQKGGIVHRLDKDTSGVMVLAKTEAAYLHLKQQFLERKTIKKYVALVHGAMKDQQGLITEPIERHPKDRHKFTVGGDLARASITEWKVLKNYPTAAEQFTLLELLPHTGRTHQLRVHLQHITHPIVSDPIYGFQKKVKDDLKICPRLFLHAKYLEFNHPSGEQVHFESDLPVELQAALDTLAKG